MKDVTLTESNGLLFVGINTTKAKQTIGHGESFSVNIRDKQWVIDQLIKEGLTFKEPKKKGDHMK